MNRENLKDSTGQIVCVDEGESCRIVVTFTDYDGTNILAASIATLECTLKDAETGTVINGRDDQSVANANGGTLTDEAGVATLKLVLDQSDNINVGGLLTGRETHNIDFKWTWNDGTAFRTGISKYRFDVCVEDTSSCDIPWVG